MIDDMASTMTRLPDPAPPASLAATVMARIARLPDERSALPPAETFAVKTTSGRGERLAWGWGLGGLVIAFGMYVRSEMAAGTLPDLISSRIGHVPLVTIPVEPAMLVLGLGLVLYLRGLFSPLRRATSKEQGGGLRR
jgi:hypothetical protein